MKANKENVGRVSPMLHFASSSISQSSGPDQGSYQPTNNHYSLCDDEVNQVGPVQILDVQ